MGDEAIKMQIYVRLQVSGTEIMAEKGKKELHGPEDSQKASWRIQIHINETERGRMVCL